MSHAEAFGQLRSFMVGLETKARDLRKVLESSRNEDGKWVNGKDGTGIGERCSRAIGAASPGQVTKEMIAEVAEQDRLMRQAEETMRNDRPIEEATEKYQALVEYNQLALEDLEERLSAYGYVRPARVALDTDTAASTAAPPGVSSVARLPAGAKTGGRPAANGCHKSRPHQCETRGGGGGGGFAAAGNGAATAGSGAAAGTEKEGDAESGDGLEAGGVPTAAEAFAGSGAAGGGEGEAEEEEDATADGAVAAAEGAASDTAGVSTPARATTTLAVPEEGGEEEEDDEEEPGSPPTPASPGLADWEITEGARDMLRRAQPQQQQQQQQQQQDQSERSSSGGGAAAAAPRSLEALLAENSVLSGGGSRGGGGGGGGRRSSVSSNWSPPPSSTAETALSRSSSSREQRRRSCGVGVGRVDDGTPSESSGGTGAADTPITGRAAVSPWGGSSSNPPTPARMKFEGWTPEERDPAGTGGNRVCSTGTPSLGFRSPLNSDVTASLIETALSVGKRPDVASTPSEEGACHSGTEITRPKPTPIKRLSLQGNESSVTGSLPKGKGPRGDFWGNASPESSVVASSRENTAEHRPDPPHSPETPATPRMLSPRFLAESANGGDDTGRGGGAASACSSDRVTRSASRAMNPAAPKAADGPGGDADASVSTDWRGSDHDGRDGSDGFDSDACPTPELSSPLRSATVSVRDLQVLTPSAKVNTADGGGYSGGSTYNYDDDDDDDDSEQCPTPELSSPLRSAGSAALCRRRLEEAGGDGGRGDDDEVARVGGSSGPLDFVSEEEYARAPKFLTIQVSRSVLNDTIGNLNAYAAPRLASPSELLLTVDEIMGIIDQGELSRTLLLSAAHLKRIEMKGPRMYRIRT